MPDKKRTLDAKIHTQAVRQVRKNRQTERRFTAKSFTRLLAQGM